MDEVKHWLADEVLDRLCAKELHMKRVHRGERTVELNERRRRKEVEQGAIVIFHLLAELPDEGSDAGITMKGTAGLRCVQNERVDDRFDECNPIARLVEEATAEKGGILREVVDGEIVTQWRTGGGLVIGDQ